MAAEIGEGMGMGFKDLFSLQSSDYARFRPTYPPALFEYLAGLAPARQAAWDCGTGNGQAAVALARHFGRVIATDPSEKQLAAATPDPRVEYRRAAAESSGLPDASVDLVTVAQAFHWFRPEEFFAEVRRVLKPRGVLAIWCYGLATITPEVDAAVLRLYEGILGPYWEKERRMVDEGYGGVRLPFEEGSPPAFAMTARWSLGHLIGYLSTWSALQTYLKSHSENPLEALYPELKMAWGEPETREIRWELALKIGIR